MWRTTRWMTGALLAVAGAALAVISVFLTWYGNRDGQDIRIQDLFNQMTTQSSNSLTSVLIPMAVAAVLVLAGLVVGWRWLWALAGLVALTAVYLWGLRQAQTVPGLHASLVGAGVPLAFSGGALMLLGSVVAAKRHWRKRAPAREAERVSPEWTPTDSTRVGETEATREPRLDESAESEQHRHHV